MGRGRPRGNQTQRNIGRAVGHGLRGTEIGKLKLSTLVAIWIILVLITLVLGSLDMALEIGEMLLLILSIIFFIFG